MRDVLKTASATDLLDSAELAVSELVTNAVVHAGTEIELRIQAEDRGLRVEIADGSSRLPIRRTWSPTAGTGRGLHIVEQSTDRWDVDPTPGGKTVWFEIGQLPEQVMSSGGEVRSADGSQREDAVLVTLLDAPLLMHRAWQEHAAALLREYLLFALEEDPAVLDAHAAASDAMSILDEQMPVPTLPAEPEALMANSVEPGVSSGVTLRVPRASVSHFAVLDELLSRAVAAAQGGHLLGPPTQPEIIEMRQWLCGEVAAQAAGPAEPRPWRGRIDVRVPIEDDPPVGLIRRELASSEEPLIATDENSVIVGVSPEAVRFLGYDDADQLLGRRILVVIPERYHQAHIAGITFHATNGRDALLERWITAPVMCADGTETLVEFVVEPHLIDGHRIFIARFRFT